jgi:hypothetical protein
MDYNSSSFRNGAIDRLKGKFGKDKPTHQPVDFKANAEKRVAENIKKDPRTYTETNVNDQNTKISSLKDPQSKTYVDVRLDSKPLKGRDVKLSGYRSGKGGVAGEFLRDAEQNMAVTAAERGGKYANTQIKMKTLAPSYVDPKGPSKLQGTNKRGTKIAKK